MGKGTPATTALARAGVTFVEHRYTHDPAAASYGLEAAQALGVEPARVFKTLIAHLEGGPSGGSLVVGIVPVDRTLDLKALARGLGGKRAVMAEIAAAERSSGYVAGGISPIGQRKSLPTVMDESALAYSTVFVSGGQRGFDIELAPADLVTLTRALALPIAG